MPDKTTIVLILFAGNSATTEQLDPLLKQIQRGLRDPRITDDPEVHCLYQRISTTGYQFSITADTADFDHAPNGDLTNFPPTGNIERHGSLSCQMTAFLNSVNEQLPQSGPVHVIIGAHGIPGRGFNPTAFFRFLLSLLLSPFDSELRGKSWRTKLQQMWRRVFLTNLTPGAFAMKRGAVALTLDDAGLALGILKPRLQALLLHTCSLSAVETMCALSAPTFHIACENLLSSHMRISKWFPILSSPMSDPQVITTAWRTSMVNDTPNALGCFSSQRVATQQVSDLLEKLNALGTHLFGLLPVDLIAGPNAVETAIQAAQDASWSAGTTDIVRFCLRLSGSREIPATAKAAASALISAVGSLQLGSVKTDTTPSDYGGISVYLPERKSNGDKVELLPASFRAGATGWVKFAERWEGNST